MSNLSAAAAYRRRRPRLVEGILSAISTDNMITVISAREVTVEGYPAQCA